MSDDSKIAELKNQFIVDTKKYELRDLSNLLERTIRFVKVGTDGRVFFDKSPGNDASRIVLILSSRYLAHRLSEDILATLTLDEIVSFGRVDKKSAANRMSELVGQGYAVSEARGRYMINPLKIEDLLQKIEAGRSIGRSVLARAAKFEKQVEPVSESSASNSTAKLSDLLTKNSGE